MTPSAQPVAYLRKSVRGRDEIDRSRDLQASAVAALAARDGVTIARVYDGDWGRSGGRKAQSKRSAMAELTAAIRAGDVSALYAYSLDRIGRDTQYGLELWHACADQGVPIVTDSGRFDTSDSTDRMRFVVTMEMAAGELDRTTKRNRGIKSRLRERFEAGEITEAEYEAQRGGKAVYGSDPTHPGEDPAVVIAAYRKAGSFLGAARALTAAVVPTRHGRPWTVRSVAVLVRREAPEIARKALARKGVSAKRTRLFAGLLTCRCGSTLTSMPRPGRIRLDGTVGPGSIAYYCRVGHLDSRHGAPYMVSERKVLRWAWNEANRAPGVLRAWADGVNRPAVSLANLAAKRAAIVDLAADLTITPADARKRLAKLDAQSKGAEAAQRAWMIIGAGPGVDWSQSPSEVNATLRTIWAEIRLGADMLPVEADWIVSPYAGPDDVDPGDPYGGPDDGGYGAD